MRGEGPRGPRGRGPRRTSDLPARRSSNRTPRPFAERPNRPDRPNRPPRPEGNRPPRPSADRGPRRPSDRPNRPTKSKPQPGQPLETRDTKTLERILSKSGIGSRTQARSMIHEGRVAINGKPTQNPDQWINPKTDRITIDDRPLEPETKTYLLLYKPKGFVTTAKDPDGRPTVYDLIRHVKAWVGPVGRLDLETTGLLILTNDTQFAERLTNPDHHVPKTYQVKARGLITDEQIDRLRKGVELNDGPTRPAIVTRLRNSEKYTFLEITITEGRNRQVRRMIEALESKVMKLTRVAIGSIHIGDLQIGRYRHLTPEELAELEKAAR